MMLLHEGRVEENKDEAVPVGANVYKHHIYEL